MVGWVVHHHHHHHDVWLAGWVLVLQFGEELSECGRLVQAFDHINERLEADGNIKVHTLSPTSREGQSGWLADLSDSVAE